MINEPARDPEADAIWRAYLTTGEFEQERRMRRLFRMMPHEPRCKNCYAPFQGIGGRLVRLIFSKRPSNLNPQICNLCEEFAREHQGGAEIELSLLFADVRGSTHLAESMSPKAFSQLVNRFYKAATRIMVQSDALIDKIIGDQVAGMYVPGFAGPEHARRAIEAARGILLETGHGAGAEPWIPLGVGVHTGIAYVGSVGSKGGTVDITVLGDAANTAARLSTSAGVGEILISAAAVAAAGLESGDLEKRSLDLKGKSEPVQVFVQKAESAEKV